MRTTKLIEQKIKHSDGTPGKVTFGLHYLQGNSDAYFTVTAWFSGQNRNQQFSEFGGACHDDILAVRPDLKPLVDLHLSDSNGHPMHLYANAESHAGIGKWSKFAPRWLASHLRISDEAADDLANNPDKDRLKSFIDSQIPRYEAEARKAIEHFELA